MIGGTAQSPAAIYRRGELGWTANLNLLLQGLLVLLQHHLLRRRPFHLIVSLVPCLPFESGLHKANSFRPQLRADGSSASPDIFSNMSALSLDDLVGTAEQENSRKDKGKYTMPESSISQELHDFLESTSGLIPANSLSVIEYALENIGCGQWEGYLKLELQVNSGMAKALFLMMSNLVHTCQTYLFGFISRW